MLVIANSMIFGVPPFSTLPVLEYFYFPNETTRTFIYNPGSCYFSALHRDLMTGYETIYINIIIPLLVFILVVLLIGRVWCGWLCPLGLPQDLLIRVRKFLKIPYHTLSYATVAFLNRFKYVFLFLILLIYISIGIPQTGLAEFKDTLALSWEYVNPAKPLYTLAQQCIGWLSLSITLPAICIFILAMYLIGAFAIRRFWCRICPIGALMAPLNRRALISLRKDGTKCTKCRACLRVCPMDFHEVYEVKERINITGPECIQCYRCVELCPQDRCLSVAFLNKEFINSKSLWMKYK
jgi:polyferredoxin